MGVHADADTYSEVKELLGIPEEEPVFILRAQDDMALHILVTYQNVHRSIEDQNVRPNQEWFDGMERVVQRFANFRTMNPEKMKVAD